MSPALGRLVARLSARPCSPLTRSLGPGRAVPLSRTAVCSSSGAILPRPRKTPFGPVRIALVVLPFLGSEGFLVIRSLSVNTTGRSLSL
ncbi:unnamed protein product [Pleuronectes platessa]|uniref:Essential MCU regulator, mitochondrial n=1 Tax=Pleuronectes platessa TaxID=8262 RepID=A0A9N7VKH6_PLEPL|nr:unnamed protein product [Pleuronectes platessa]